MINKKTKEFKFYFIKKEAIITFYIGFMITTFWKEIKLIINKCGTRFKLIFYKKKYESKSGK